MHRFTESYSHAEKMIHAQYSERTTNTLVNLMIKGTKHIISKYLKRYVISPVL